MGETIELCFSSSNASSRVQFNGNESACRIRGALRSDLPMASGGNCMKTHIQISISAAGLVLLAFGWFGGGCAAPTGASAAPKPGRGIAEYRGVVREAHQSVAAIVNSLAGLAVSPTQTSVPSAALARFDKAFKQLELTSVKARSRAEAIIARGQAYFDDWKGNLTSITNQAAATAETQRFDRLFDHFGRVRQRSGGVREEFRPFMEKLREFRAGLDRSSGAVSSPAFQNQLDGLTASGRRVLESLESVSTALDQAEAELRATLATTR
jgi:hypothetical protein